MIFIERMFLIALALAVITIGDSTFYPLLLMLFISRYFSIFVLIVSGKNLSL